MRMVVDDSANMTFDWEEFMARLEVGVRVVGSQKFLAGRIEQLNKAISRISMLQGVLSICSDCKRFGGDCSVDYSKTPFGRSVCGGRYNQAIKEIVGKLDEIMLGATHDS